MVCVPFARFMLFVTWMCIRAGNQCLHITVFCGRMVQLSRHLRRGRSVLAIAQRRQHACGHGGAHQAPQDQHHHQKQEKTATHGDIIRKLEVAAFYTAM